LFVALYKDTKYYMRFVAVLIGLANVACNRPNGEPLLSLHKIGIVAVASLLGVEHIIP
jgi:hypothetical protein